MVKTRLERKMTEQCHGGRGGGEWQGQSPPSDNFLGALKFVIANVKYDTKYVTSSLSTNSKIVVILAFL